jgi:hypothetical protein
VRLKDKYVVQSDGEAESMTAPQTTARFAASEASSNNLEKAILPERTDVGLANEESFPSFRSFQPSTDSTDSSDAASLAAQRLLMSPTFFTDCLSSLKRMGLAGEKKNALALYLVGTSRVLQQPMNVLVKGHSSSGKNHLVSRVLGLFPEDSYVEVTSASEKAWHYSGDSFANKIVYIQEQNKASGSVHPVRLLISEGKLVRLATVRKKGSEHNTTERFEAKGPIASLSTTTQDRLEIDDETRHISLWMDDSPEQTKRILKSYTQQPEPLSEAEVAAWRAVQELVTTRTGIEIVLPTWFDEVAEAMVDAGHDVRLRRYFPAFCQACRSLALLRSFQCKETADRLQVEFADFAIAHILLDSVVSESLQHEGGQVLDTAQCIRGLTVKTGDSVRIQQVADALNLPYKRAAERIQEAERAGLVQLANSPEVRNVKRFVATSPQQLLPAPEALFRKLGLNAACSFHHPLTGELVAYVPETAETRKAIIPAPRTMTVPVASKREKNSIAKGYDRQALLDASEQAGLVGRNLVTPPSVVPCAQSSGPEPGNDIQEHTSEPPVPEPTLEPAACESQANNPDTPARVNVIVCPPVRDSGLSDSTKPPAQVEEQDADNIAALRLTWIWMPEGKRYEVRPVPTGGFGIYEKGSNVLFQWYETEEKAEDMIIVHKEGLPSALKEMKEIFADG